MNFADLDLYERLGVAEDATQEEIKAAHRRTVKQLHSDQKPGAYAAMFDALLAGVNAAYDVLKNPEQRAKYDAGNLRGYPPPRSRRAEHEARRQRQEEARQRQRREEQRQQQQQQEEARQRQRREQRQRAQEQAPDDEEYYWQEPDDAPHEESRRASLRPAGPGLFWRIYGSARYVRWAPIVRLVVLVAAPLVVLYLVWSLVSAGWNAFEDSTRAAAQERQAERSAQAEKAAISETARQAAEEELTAYYDAFACSGCSADALVSQVEAHVSAEWWKRPAGKELQRTTRKMASGKELRQTYSLDEFEEKKPGPLSGRDEADELRGTAYWSGRSVLGKNDSGPMRQKNEVRMQPTENGGWTVIYAGSSRDR